MAATIKTRPAQREPRITIAEIDEALMWSSLLPERDGPWQRWINHLLDQRLRLMR